MRWIKKDNRPEQGTLKTKRHFSFLPTKIYKTYVWLEFYTVVYRYERFIGKWVVDHYK